MKHSGFIQAKEFLIEADKIDAALVTYSLPDNERESLIKKRRRLLSRVYVLMDGRMN